MDQHFDAERLAAFADGSLSAAERAVAEAHAADCPQCLQLLAAMARTHEERPRPSPGPWQLPGFVRWVAPIAAAATGVALWFNMSDEPRQEPVVTDQAKSSVTQPARPAADEALSKDSEQEQRRVADARAVDQKIGQRAAANERKESSSAKARDESAEMARADKQAELAKPYSFSTRSQAATPAPETAASIAPAPQAVADAPASSTRAAEENLRGAAAPPPPPSPAQPPAPSERVLAGAKPTPAATPSAVAETVTVTTKPAAADKLSESVALRRRLGAVAAIESSSPDRRYRWRTNGAVVERSIDSGSTWIRLPGMPGAAVLAIASPAANVAWFVGRAGTVFVFSDGTWTRGTFPESIDLTAVRAVSNREAQITTLDGRVFRTADGGQTWSVQENP